jgi:hypothetical protein
MSTEEDRQAEIERIHTEATSAVLMHICQIFDGIRAELSSEKKRLGFSQTFVVNGSVERECQGLIELIKDNLANSLPIDPVKAVESEDHFDLLNEDGVTEIAARVRNTVRELLGVFEKDKPDD